MSHFLHDETINTLISGIYDCAINPDGWTALLDSLRDVMDLRLTSVTIMKSPISASDGPPALRHLHSEWDVAHLELLPTLVPIIPNADRWFQNEIDIPLSQMQLVNEDFFRKTEFYRQWVAPKDLRDSCCSVLIKRPGLLATLNATSGSDRELISEQQRQLLQILSPHFRRALLISDLLDDARQKQELYHATLDAFGTGVVLLDGDARILHANSAAARIIRRDGPLSEVSGRLWTQAAAHRIALLFAIRRACLMPDAALGTWGSGIALAGQDGSAAAVYVLPIGLTERRRAIGPGRAAVFITDAQGSRPPSVEIVCALTGLTAAESRAALGIAEGTSLEALAESQGISLHTLRRHLANAYEKTGHNSQAALGAFVNRLRVPLA